MWKKKTVDVKNNKDKYSIEEIATRICTYSEDYRNNLLNGIAVSASAKIFGKVTLHYFIISNVKSTKAKVIRGEKLGVLSSDYNSSSYSGGYYPIGVQEIIKVPISGILEYNMNAFDLYETSLKVDLAKLPKNTVTVGKIFLPEYEFYMDNKTDIDELVKIKLSTKEMERQKRIESQENTDKLLKIQNTSLENIDTLLTELDKYILDNKLPVIETLQAINDDLKTLYEQRENISNIKFIKDCESHFENAYKEVKKNSSLTDIIEQRMIDILRTFFEISGETEDSINTKLDEIKNAGDEKKFSINFDNHLKELDESVSHILASYENNKKVDFEELKTLEHISIFFTDPKSRMNQIKHLEGSKNTIESLWSNYSKLEDKSSLVEETLKRIVSNLYEAFGSSKEDVQIIFAKHRVAETIKKLNSQIMELEEAIVNNAQIKVAALQNIAEYINELAKYKDTIQDKTEIESSKIHFETIYKDCKRRKDFSSIMKLRMQEILNGFNEILEKNKDRSRK